MMSKEINLGGLDIAERITLWEYQLFVQEYLKQLRETKIALDRQARRSSAGRR